MVLTPGSDWGQSSNPRIGGGLLDGQSEQLDGAESNSERRNDPAMNGVSVEGMEEFKVQSSSYSAEYGRTSNGVINWVTKSGTNQVHGSMFVFNRNEVFNARGFTTAASKRPIVRQWNPGRKRWRADLPPQDIRRPQQGVLLLCLRTFLQPETASRPRL